MKTVIRHGKSTSYEYHRCRCDRCTVAHSERIRDLRARSSVSLTSDDPRHGTRNAYDNLGCRCDQCRQAKSAAHREYVNRKPVA